MTETDSAVMYLILGAFLWWVVSKIWRGRAPRMRRVFPRKPMASYVDRAPDMDACRRNTPGATGKVH